MYSHPEIIDLVSMLPADLRTRIIRTNAQFDILSDADQKMGWDNKILNAMQDDLWEQFRTLYSEALYLMPYTIENEQPNADGECPMQGLLEFTLRRL